MKQPNYEAVIKLSPPENNDQLTIAVTLYPSDKITVDGEAKRLRDCTLDELKIYADNLEADVAEVYQQMTIGDLMQEENLDLSVDTDSEDWLDYVVVLDPPASDEVVAIEMLPTAAEQAVAEEQAAPDPIEPEPEPEVTVAETVVAEAVVAEQVVEEVEEISVADEPEEIEEIAVADDDGISEGVSAEPLPPTQSPAEIIVDDAEQIIETTEVTESSVTSQPDTTTDRTAGQDVAEHANKHNSVIILLDEQPLRQMQTHARSSLRREVAGVMVGPIPEKQPDGRYVVHVTDMIIAKHTIMSGASVTYTPESWRYMNDTLMERYPNQDHVMVGWYHTHPGFGIFLSNMDLFIHTNFFTQDWHIAYVLDPIAYSSGFFSWNRKKDKVMAYNFPWPEWAPRSW